MKSERLQILKMLEQGQITIQEAAELLSAVEKPQTGPGSTRGRWMRVRVVETTSGRDKVNVTVPLGLVDVALRLGARLVPKTSKFDPQHVLEAIHDGDKGMVMKYEDFEAGERVEIYVD